MLGKWAVPCALAAGACGFALGALLMPPKDSVNNDIHEKLESEQPADRQKAIDALAKHRRELIELALALAKQPDDGKTFVGKKECGIRMLGELRAEREVPFLLDQITFNPPGVDFVASELQGYPAVKALIKIGNAAAKDILDFRLSGADEKTRPLYAYILKRVWGPEIARTLVKEKLEGKLSGDERAAFQAALEYFESAIKNPLGHE